MKQTVHWAELRPDDFVARRAACPVVYLPVGLCEPHGHVAALGLDLLKAEYYCAEAARRAGGIVAPAQGYHIHECGFHAPWLAEVLGNEDPLMAALPPHVMLQLFLYQLRAFANTGFRAVVAVSGHSGGTQEDLRRVAEIFSWSTGVAVVVKSDPEWVRTQYQGDHAGRYEISQLLAIRPDLVDLSLLGRQHVPGSGGRLALGDDAAEATAAYGREINEAIITAILGDTTEALARGRARTFAERLGYPAVDAMWREVCAAAAQWSSCRLHPGQTVPSAGSAWRPYATAKPIVR